MRKCKVCENYIVELDTCKFCSFRKMMYETGEIEKAWFGFSKFDDDPTPYLSLEIALSDGWRTTMTFRSEDTSKILSRLIPDDEYHKTVSKLVTVPVYLLPHPNIDAISLAPIAISDTRGNWIYKKGWKDGKEM